MENHGRILKALWVVIKKLLKDDLKQIKIPYEYMLEACSISLDAQSPYKDCESRPKRKISKGEGIIC